jgi:hypothetical protein
LYFTHLKKFIKNIRDIEHSEEEFDHGNKEDETPLAERIKNKFKDLKNDEGKFQKLKKK